MVNPGRVSPVEAHLIDGHKITIASSAMELYVSPVEAHLIDGHLQVMPFHILQMEYHRLKHTSLMDTLIHPGRLQDFLVSPVEAHLIDGHLCGLGAL